MIRHLPQEAAELMEEFVRGLQDILGNKLYGVYLYGASVFPDAGPLQDIDCHVIVRKALTQGEISACRAQFHELEVRYPGWGDELDAYTILLDDARKPGIPQHQVFPDVYDHSWALHCAHVRAGYIRVVYGPDPGDIFPTPTWQAVDAALQHELQYVLDHPQYPAYGILNLCRILYSYETRDPAVSKQFSGRWSLDRFPDWADLIHAAMRFYRQEASPEDLAMMEADREKFYTLVAAGIAAAREKTVQ